MTAMLRYVSFVFFVAGLLAPSWAVAHQTGSSTFVVHLKSDEGVVDTLITLPGRDVGHHIGLDGDESGQVDLSELTPGYQKVVDEVRAGIRVTNGGEDCVAVEEKSSPVHQSVDAFWLLVAFECEMPWAGVEIENRVLSDVKGGYRHLAKVQIDDEMPSTSILGTTQTSVTLELGETSTGVWDTVWSYFVDGVAHIILGPDHVIFVVLIILMTVRVRRLVLVITSFTIAHSITLGISALNIFSLDPGIVEPVIALSILYMALETGLREEQPRYLFLMTFVFGLVHGFGFSYVLRDEVGLPTEALVPALASFNVGVEAGQLAIVALIFPLRLWLHEKPFERRVLQVVSALAGLIAVGWFVQRVFLT